MTYTEIFLALDKLRDTLIQSHVQLNDAMDQIEKLKQNIEDDIGKKTEDK